MAQKTFVLDTNVLLHDPDAMFVFADNKVVIPMTVIEELDMLKRHNDELGRNSRLISRKLDFLRSKGNLIEGVKLDNGGIIKIELDWDKELPPYFIEDKADHRILAVALKLKKEGEKVIFITKDINLRIKAEALGIVTQDYEKAKVHPDTVYTGFREIETSQEVIDRIFSLGRIPLSDLKKQINSDLSNVYLNEFLILKYGKSHSLLLRIKKNNKTNTYEAEVVSSKEVNVWGLKPLNVQQRFAIELLLDDSLNLVSLIGVAGAGKTLLSLACGLHKVIEEKLYRRLLISRPVVPMGRDIGYLPGSKEEKLSSWMGAIYDNLDFLIGKIYKYDSEKLQSTINYFFDSGLIEVEALTYLRGRSLPNQFFIIDDAQNLTPHEIKTIISRAGENTKIVLTGDPFQIDNPYLDASSNGLIYLVDRFKGQELFGHITFTKTERSQLAALAAELL
ncbi:MAG: PhoH family protein [Elusimicrobiota bacterium]|nr:PhoH family protein [Endomicrobiia bacterium]MCX7910208.1 PhoH family protein [Endomicrobiia bacterium]MDW8165275.1 PhoH family protein [Elusimicrobiota bacterium]